MIPSFAATLGLFSRAVRVRRTRGVAVMPRRKPTAPQCTALPPGLNAVDFAATWTVFALKVPQKLCNNVRLALKAHVLQIPRVRGVQQPPAELGADQAVLLLLKYFASSIEPIAPGTPVGNADFGLVDASPADVSAILREAQRPAKASNAALEFLDGVAEEDIATGSVQITHLNWSVDGLLRWVLPAGVVVPSAFETIGHIVHLNLRPEHEPHKALIGAVILAKLRPRIRTVVNKLSSLEGPYRTFPMEVLAGDPDTETEVRENGCKFSLDFAKVYWNSRLETEHRRIVDSLKEGDVLADAFAGIGPFAVPAAKLGKCKKVYANDLNPSSVEYLRRNAKNNGANAKSLIASCGCARTFMRGLIRDEKVGVTKVVMNFPSGAPEFLDMFAGLYRGMEADSLPMPIVHCYCFVKFGDAGEARRRVRTALFGLSSSGDVLEVDVLRDEDIAVRTVRNVSPSKDQVCVSFQIPEQVAYAAAAEEVSQEKKRQKTEALR